MRQVDVDRVVELCVAIVCFLTAGYLAWQLWIR
jgi:hypothetical protein